MMQHMHIEKRNWFSLAALVPPVALVFMDQTILPVALPTIHRELGAGNIALQWCVNAYILAISVFVLLCGKISDRMGHRRTLCSGMVLFAFSSVLCGLSPSVEWLICGRAFQGIGAALMFPSQTVLIAKIFAPEKRGRASGVIVSLGAVFMVLGPLLGGFLTEHLSWRWIFWVNIPVAILGLGLIFLFLPSIQPGKNKIDLLGFVFFAITSTSMTLFFMQAPAWGWFSPKILICFFSALISLFLLIRRENKTSHPFLDLKLFRISKYAAISICVSITQFILMVTVFQTIYFQEILQFSPMLTGLLTFISCLPVFAVPIVAGFLSDRFNPKVPITIGYILLISSFLILSVFSTPSLPLLVGTLIAFGAGIPFIFTPSYSTAMSVVPQEKLGIAFGLLITLRMFAGSLGLALINLFVDTVKNAKLPKLGERLAEIASFTWVHFTLALLLLIAFILTLLFYHKKSTHHFPNTPAEGWD